jgi:hypothetical protein
MKNSPPVHVNSAATAEAVRAKYGSVQEFCRQAAVHPDTFYLALRGKRGLTRKKSQAALVLKRLDSEGLLEKAS